MSAPLVSGEGDKLDQCYVLLPASRQLTVAHPEDPLTASLLCE